MADGQLESVLHHVRQLVAEQSAGSVPDRELLECFVARRDESAFAALVRRHGAMVLGVCRRVLRHRHDAEDASQAAFLVLARKAASIRNQQSVASWLHGVALRVAANLKREVARRQRRQEALMDVPREDATHDVTWREVQVVLDEECQRLPQHFRSPLVLCYLEGKTRDEAARELGWSLGTLRGRLERGRTLLRNRLARRGLTLSATLLGAAVAPTASAMPAGLAASTAKAAARFLGGRAVAGVVSARVVALTDGVLRTMFLTRVKIVV